MKEVSDLICVLLLVTASGNMSLENFAPGWYLLENHHNAR